MNNKTHYIHEKTFAIAWGDMDALGHVNNGKYFDYFQEARIEWLRTLSLDMTQQEGPVVVHVAATFLKPIVYPARLTIKSSIHSQGRSSMIMNHDIYQGDTLMSQGSSKVVWIDYIHNKSIPLPEKIRTLFKNTNSL